MRMPSALAGLLLVACASVPTQTTYMKESGVAVTSDALRTRLRAEAVYFTGSFGGAADAARDRSTDPAARRRALVWKTNVVPALYRTLYQQRPLVALFDTWALLLQAEDYLASPAARAALGPGVATMHATAVELEGRVRKIAAWAAPAMDLDAARKKIAGWALQHPVQDGFATRVGIEEMLVTLGPGEDLGVLAVAGRIDDDLTGIIERLDFLTTMVPDQALWKAELTYTDLVDPRLETVLGKSEALLARFDALVAWLGPEGLEEFTDGQRETLLAAVRGERLAVEALLDRQRRELEAFAERERTAVAAMLVAERKAAAGDVERLVDHAAAEATRRAEQVVDHLVRRLAILLGGAVVLLGGVAWLVRRRRAP